MNIEEIEKRLNEVKKNPAMMVPYREDVQFLLSTIKSLKEEIRTCKHRYGEVQAERDKYREENERYVGIFERMVKGDVWMTFGGDLVEAYKELARHAIKDVIAQSALQED